MDRQKRVTILVVEDDSDAREVLRSMLAMRFPRALIYEAGDGKAGLECIRTSQPDIVISDINMPEMDGAQMIGSIPAICPEARIIVATALRDARSLDMIRSTGVHFEIVFKPIDFQLLFALIDRCISELPRVD